MLGAVLVLAWIGTDLPPPGLPRVEVESFDPRSPRRPLPREGDESFIIEDRAEQPSDSMGTAFTIDRTGVWLTAEHVTHGCARIGLEDDGVARAIGRVLESREADAALVRDGLAGPTALAVSDRAPPRGSPGYHMGFPAGRPRLVLSQLIGASSARRGRSTLTQPVLAWAERARLPDDDGTLSGISGGPVLGQDGWVVGINSASTDRRGRILTTAPDAMMRLVAASAAVRDRPPARPIGSISEAEQRFRGWMDAGAIRRIFCAVE